MSRLQWRARARIVAPILIPFLYSSLGCSFETEVAPRVELDVAVDSTGMVEFQTDLGYDVTFTRMRVAFENVEFTTSGEMHASLWKSAADIVVPTAYAHPGHYAGGEVIGEMNGRFVIDWLDARATLGAATLLEGQYDGANFVFTRATPSDGLEPDDALVGHTFDLAGEVRRGDESWTFSGVLDQDDGRRVIGLPFDFEVDAGTDEVIGLQLLPVDPYEGDTPFDGIDFATLDEDGDRSIELAAGQDAYFELRKRLQAHDIYFVTTE